MKCEVCDRTMDEVKVLHRINETGCKGKWACEKHIHLFPNKMPDDEIADIVRILAETAPEQEAS